MWNSKGFRLLISLLGQSCLISKMTENQLSLMCWMRHIFPSYERIVVAYKKIPSWGPFSLLLVWDFLSVKCVGYVVLITFWVFFTVSTDLVVCVCVWVCINVCIYIYLNFLAFLSIFSLNYLFIQHEIYHHHFNLI